MSLDDHTNACPGHCQPAAPGDASSAIGRRTFLAQSAMLAAAAALAACGAGGDVTAPTSIGSTTIRLADYPALANVGGVALLTISSQPFAIVRTDTSTFVTLSRVCPHQGSQVYQVSGGWRCPNHGAQFQLNGTWVGGQPTSSMASYPTTYDAAAGTLTIG